jgi:serine protease Do
MKNKVLVVSLSVIMLFTSFASGLLGVYFGTRMDDYLQVGEGTQNSSDLFGNQTINKVASQSENAVVDVVDKTQDAVVSIIITKDLPVYENYYMSPYGSGYDLFDFFFDQRMGRRQVGQEEQQIGAGSGFIVSSDGYIVTNRHVVEDLDASYTVILTDGQTKQAEVLARDTYLDIAIMKIEGNDYTYIELGDSDSLKVGQTVIAIGNALGEFSNTVSSGIVSGLSRSITAGSQSTGRTETMSGIIQTDASINYGNSGGPLLDLSGRAVGVNVAVAQSAENIGFAIPINSAAQIVESVRTYGKIVRPRIGIRYIQITPDLSKKMGLSVDYGVLVIRGETFEDLAVVPGSPADKAGILENDIILEINGVKLDFSTRLQDEVQKHKVGDRLTLKVLSKGEEKSIEIVLEADQ